MKKSIVCFAALVSLAGSLFLCGPTGCGTLTPQQKTYATLATTGTLANSAFSAYMDLVVKGKVATNSVPAISAAYNSFQVVYGGALAVAQYNPNAVAPSNVVAQANSLVGQINLAEGKIK